MKTLVRTAIATALFAVTLPFAHANAVAYRGDTTGVMSRSNYYGGVYGYVWTTLTSPSGKLYQDTRYQPNAGAGVSNTSVVYNEAGTWTLRQYNKQGAGGTVNLSSTSYIDVREKTCVITVNVAPASNYGSASGGGTVNMGSSVTLSATAAAGGYKFKSWTINASQDTGGNIVSYTGANTTSSTYTFTASANATYYANFTPPVYQTLTVTLNGSGSVSPSSGTAFLDGTTINLHYVEGAGYSFAGWSGDLSGTNNDQALVMNGPKSITATFSPKSYTVSAATSPAGVGTVSGGGTYTYGQSAKLTAPTVIGYSFDDWSGSISSSSNPVSLTVDGNKSVTANYHRNVATVTVTSATYTYDGSGKTATVTTSPSGLSYSVTYNGGGAPANAGSYTAVATITDPNWTGNGTGTLTINPMPANFSFTQTSFTYNRSAQRPTINNPSGATYSVAGTSSATNAGSYSFTVTATGNYTGSNTCNWSIAKATPTVSWAKPAGITYPAALSTTQLNATASDAVGSVAGSYAYTPAAGTVLNAGGSQALSVAFAPADTTNYNGASGATTIDVAAKSVDFGFSPTSFTYNRSAQRPTINNPYGATYSVSGTSSATNAGSYSFTVTATGNYTGSNTCNWSIAKATPTISWAKPAGITYPAALSATQLNATASDSIGAVAGSFAYTPAAGTVLNAGGSQALSVAFAPADTTNYNGANGSTTIDVNPKSVTFGYSPTSFVYTGSAQGPTISNPDGASYAISGTQSATAANTYAFTITATGNYTGTQSCPWSIGRRTPAVNWPRPGAIAYPTLLSTAQLNATADVAGSFTYTPVAGTLLEPGAGQPLAVHFAPNDSTNFAETDLGNTIDVGTAAQQVAISPPSATVSAGARLTFSASGGSNGYSWGGAASGTGNTQSALFASPGKFEVNVYSPASKLYQQSNTAVAGVTVNAVPQSVSLAPAAALVEPGEPVTLVASGGMNGYVWGGAANGNGSTKALTFAMPGTYGVTVLSPAGGAFLESNTAKAQITVAIAQTINFPPPGSFVLRAVGTSLLATASSGLPVRFTIVSGPGTLTPPRYVRFGALGAIVVQADQDGDATYAPAPSVRQTIPVNAPPETTLQYPSAKSGLILGEHQDTNHALPQPR